MQATEKENPQPEGTVLSQEPAKGATLPPGGTVQIVVASPRPTVPDVTTNNPTVDEATKTLEDAGYKVETTERRTPTRRWPAA